MATRTAARNLGRMSEIAQVAVRHGFGYFLEATPTDRPLAVGREGFAVEEDRSQRGQHLREMFDELGPTFVKFGQLLSTRPDVVPPDIIVELRKLQDDVTPFPYTQVEEVVEARAGAADREALPRVLADADRRRVDRPGAQGRAPERPCCRRQGAASRRTAPDRGRSLSSSTRRRRSSKERVRALDFVDARALVDEFGRSLREELDYRLEARNAQTFYRNFAGDPHVRIPKVYWSYTRSRVLTLEHLEGVQLRDLEPDDYTVEERRRLAYLMAEVWMTMIFRHGFFHGDPHPANVLVLGHPEHIGIVDFGLVGKLSDDDMTKLTRLFIDAAHENVEALPKRFAELGVGYDRSREDEFVARLRELYDRYYGVRLAEIDPMQLIREGFQLTYAMNLRLPARFLMLDKAIVTLTAVGVELYPDFNVFEVAKPYARDLLVQRYTPQRLLGQASKEIRSLAEVIRAAPYQWHDFLQQASDGQIEVGFVHKGLDDFLPRFEHAFNRLVVSLVVAGGLIGSSLIGIFAKSGPHLIGLHVISLIGFAISGVLGMWLLWGVVRSGRL